MKKPIYAATLTVAVGLLVLPLISSRHVEDPSSEDGMEVEVEGELPPAIAKKLAQRARYAPDLTGALEGEGRGAAEQDWLEHATPGDDIPYLALVGSRQGWNLLKARPGGGGGKWTPLGPTYAKGADNPYRDRSVYNAGHRQLRRSHHCGRDRPAVRGRRLPSLDCQRERRRLANRRCPGG